MLCLFSFKFLLPLCFRICCICTYCLFLHLHIMLLYPNVLKPYKMIVCRVYFKETPVEVVKEHDQELSKLGADALIPAMPGHVVQAFTLLKSSPEAQSVVASLASDKNVWDAVLKNERVMEFYKSHQQTLVNTFPEGTDSSDSVESPEKFEEASPEYALPTASPLSDFVDNAKKTMMEMVDNITNFFQDLFHNPAEAEARPGSSSKKPSFAEMAAGGSFMALAMAVILVVLFKRA
ncbi:unnamed protein product [Triticum turgidum subsp. durum]|uniref:Uncharacterized protein n=1 Tax=Triticum turgidum subsp. durum TaxID=4567 RepID=A0A9R1BRC6_TRITD|nr:unnamed protein product [Triticum turgidum subsp. durum]